MIMTVEKGLMHEMIMTVEKDLMHETELCDKAELHCLKSVGKIVLIFVLNY